MPFLALSPELIENVLYELPSRDLVACMLLSKFICTTICGSIRLRYKLALLRFGAEDNIFSTLPTNAKLKSLSDSQQAWIGLKPAYSYRLGFPLPIGRNASLAEGMLYGSRMHSGAHDIVTLSQLTTSRDAGLDSPDNIFEQDWRRYGSGSRRSSRWIAYTASVYEHGLIAEVISEWEGEVADATTFKISVYLRQFSASETQHNAHCDCGEFCLVPESLPKHIYIMDCPDQEPYLSLQIVGRRLVIIVGAPEYMGGWTGEDNIFVYDFYSDVLLMAFRAIGRTYRGIVFLDENFILLPNTDMGKLDIFRIPSQPKFEPVAPVISLDLPILHGNRFLYGSITCTANPNPISESSLAEMHRRFSMDPPDSLRYTFHPERGHFKRAEESVCVFTVQVEKVRYPRNAPRRIAEEFTIVVHRSALLEIAVKHEEIPSPANHPQPDPLSPSHPWPDFEGTSMDDPLMSRIQVNPRMAHIQEHDDTGQPFWSMPRARTCISWENWGPRITRWFNNSNLAEGDVTRGWGERCVRLAPRAHSESTRHSEGVPYHVIDFRRSNCKVAQRTTQALVARRRSAIARNPHETVFNREYGAVVKFDRETIDYVPPNFSFGIEVPTVLLNKVFIRPVISALPYYCRGSAERVMWDRVLIDDQMVVGCREKDAAYSFIAVRFFG